MQLHITAQLPATIVNVGAHHLTIMITAGITFMY